MDGSLIVKNGSTLESTVCIDSEERIMNITFTLRQAKSVDRDFGCGRKLPDHLTYWHIFSNEKAGVVFEINGRGDRGWKNFKQARNICDTVG